MPPDMPKSLIPCVHTWRHRESGEEVQTLEWDGTNLAAVSAFDGHGLQPHWTPEFGLEVDNGAGERNQVPVGHHIGWHPMGGFQVFPPGKMEEEHELVHWVTRIAD